MKSTYGRQQPFADMLERLTKRVIKKTPPMVPQQTPELEARLLARAKAAYPAIDWSRPSIFPLPAYLMDPTPAWIVWATPPDGGVVGHKAALLFDECKGIDLIEIISINNAG